MGVRLSANTFLGLDVLGATVEAAGLLADHGQVGMLRQVDPVDGRQNFQLMSFGVRVAKGGRLDLSGSRISRMIVAGAVVSRPAARLVAEGVLIDHTLAEGIGGHWGLGLLVSDGGLAQVGDSTLMANRTGAALAIAANLEVDRSLIAVTPPADYKRSASSPSATLADGIIVGPDATLTPRDTMLRDQPRSGVLVEPTGKATVSTCTITGNGFGVVSQQGAQVNIERSAIWNNAVQNVIVDQEFAVPAPPIAVGGP